MLNDESDINTLEIEEMNEQRQNQVVQERNNLIKYGVIGVIGLFFVLFIWPFYSVPVGSRGVVTQFGAIKGIEPEGLLVLPPWKKLTLFSIRAEQADIENA